MKHVRNTVLVVLLATLVAAIWSPWLGNKFGRSSHGVEAQGIAAATSTRLTLSPGSAADDAIGSMDMHGDIFPVGLTAFQLLVQPADPSIAKVIGFDTPNYGLVRADTIGIADGAGGMRLTIVDAFRLVGTTTTDFLLATVKLQSLTSGVTSVTVSILRAEDEVGQPFQAFGDTSTFTVAASRDLDGDGLTEDFNGDGVFGFLDVIAMFEECLLKC